MKLSKLEAARRQLDFAIRALFEGKDVVPIHTLVGAAHILAHDLVEEKNPGSSWANTVATANNLSLGEALGKLRETQNLLKHAAKDPNAIIEFNFQDTEFLITSVLLDLGPLQEVGDVHSIEASVYQLWFFAMYEHLFSSPEYQEMVSNARHLFPGITNMARDMQLACGLRAIEQYRECA